MSRPIDGDNLVNNLKMNRLRILLELDSDGAAVFDEIVEWIQMEPTITPPNEPLTPEELQSMCGQPVFVVSTKMGNFWALVNMNSVYVDARKCFLFDNFDAEYGKIWTAYRRPPEGENLE